MEKKLLYPALIGIVIIVAAVVLMNQSGPVPNSTPVGGEPGSTPAKTYTIGEISAHDSREDCWLLISGKVYDVTDFIQSHPGGTAILEGCGKDATSLYETKPMGSGTPHSEDARARLPDYYIGDLG
ncbi:MAG: cytochrome b5 domain-containing protein [Candidatus Altiarchaeota archaeon]|nr:cytochrome b5 domain-containing protein [Candidatus Altiarchaeota archaeon]